MKRTVNHTSGFSLVEIALALVVMSIGVLTIFGLFASSMEGSRKSDAETKKAFFVMTVFNVVAAEMQRDWDERLFPLGQDWVEDNAADQPDSHSGLVRLESAGSPPNQIGYIERMDHGDDTDALIHWFTYTLAEVPITADQHRGLRLEVWPGQFANTANDGAVFYTEVYLMQ